MLCAGSLRLAMTWSSLVFAGSLLAFHIYLIRRNLTTAEYLRPNANTNLSLRPQNQKCESSNAGQQSGHAPYTYSPVVAAANEGEPHDAANKMDGPPLHPPSLAPVAFSQSAPDLPTLGAADHAADHERRPQYYTSFAYNSSRSPPNIPLALALYGSVSRPSHQEEERQVPWALPDRAVKPRSWSSSAALHSPISALKPLPGLRQHEHEVELVGNSAPINAQRRAVSLDAEPVRNPRHLDAPSSSVAPFNPHEAIPNATHDQIEDRIIYDLDPQDEMDPELQGDDGVREEDPTLSPSNMHARRPQVRSRHGASTSYHSVQQADSESQQPAKLLKLPRWLTRPTCCVTCVPPSALPAMNECPGVMDRRIEAQRTREMVKLMRQQLARHREDALAAAIERESVPI